MRHAVLLACAAGLAACAGGEARGTATVTADTLRGRVEVVGAEPATQVALLPDSAPAVTLDGPRPSLDRLAGLEVVVWGRRPERGHFVVERFAVRASGGIAAVDGILGRDGEAFHLTTPDGRRLTLPHLPAALRGREGTRVWIAGPLDRPPSSFGTIEP